MSFLKKLTTLSDYCEAARNDKIRPNDFLRDSDFFCFKDDDYSNVQTHSTCVDQILGIPVPEIERSLRQEAKNLQPEGTVESWSAALHEGVMTWVGLNPAQLQTPYGEIYDLLQKINPAPGESIVDFGAGYGRMGLVVGQLWPECEFIGYEAAQERVEVGNQVFKKFNMHQCSLKKQNIAAENFNLPEGPYYFIYDFGSLPDMKKLLAKLDALADQRKKFTVIARGRGINSLIQETAPYLTVDVEREGNSLIYTNL